MAITLTAVPQLLPRVYAIDYISSYVIVGGLVILPAGMPLKDAALRNRRGNWYAVYDAIQTVAMTAELTDLEQQSCILADVLAHRINVSYDKMVGEIVSKLNGTAVKNMRHLVRVRADIIGHARINM